MDKRGLKKPPPESALSPNTSLRSPDAYSLAMASADKERARDTLPQPGVFSSSKGSGTAPSKQNGTPPSKPIAQSVGNVGSASGTSPQIGKPRTTVVRHSDAKSVLRDEMNALNKNRSGGAQPGAVSVSGSGAAATSKGRTNVVRQSDVKAVLRDEMNALQQKNPDAGRPGAVSVSGSTVSATAKGRTTVIRQSDAKSALRDEVDALRRNRQGAPQTPGAVSVSSDANGSTTVVRSGDSKAVLKQEMNVLKQNVEMMRPGAVSVSLSGDAKHDINAARAERASRKARGSSNQTMQDRKEFSQYAVGAISRKEPPPVVTKPGVEYGTGTSDKAARKMPPPGASAASPSEMSVSREKEKTIAQGNVAVGLPTVEADGPAVVVASVDMPTSTASVDMPSNKKSVDNNKKQGMVKQGSLKEKAMVPFEIDEEDVVSAQIVDEGALEAEYEARILENAATAEIVSDDEMKGDRSGRLCRRICCPLILIGLVIAIVLPLTRDDGPGPRPPTPAPTEQSPFDYLFDLIEPISGDAILNASTHQYKAFNWLAFEDPALLDFKVANTSTLIDRYALAAFYFATNGQHWTVDLGFLSKNSVCEWTTGTSGVRCDEVTNEVVALRVNGNNVTGTLPPEVGALSRLNVFSAAQGGVTGTIPSELGNLPEMRTLQIALQQLSGTIPESLNRLSNLVLLNLFDNQLSGTLHPESLDSWQKMEILVLARNQLEGTLPEFHIQGPLKNFVLQRNKFKGELPRSLYMLPSMELLILSENRFSGTISQTIRALPSLETLLLDQNRFSGAIPSEIGDLEDLVELSFSDNAFTGNIPSQIGNLEKVKTVSFSNNQLGGTIPATLGNMEDLEELSVASNGIGGSVPDSFLELSKLKALFLENTMVNDGLDFFCSQSDPFITNIFADCGGSLPEISCPCCTNCCENGVCSLSLPAVCSVAGGGFEADPERGAECNCSENGRQLRCTDTACEACTLDETICSRNTDYGYDFDPSGERKSFRNVFQYTKGRNESVVFTRDFETDSCSVEIDGQQCGFCISKTCDSAFEGFEVNCENFAPGVKMDSCTNKEAGILEFLNFNNPSLVLGCPAIFDRLRPT